MGFFRVTAFPKSSLACYVMETKDSRDAVWKELNVCQMWQELFRDLFFSSFLLLRLRRGKEIGDTVG